MGIGFCAGAALGGSAAGGADFAAARATVSFAARQSTGVPSVEGT